MTIVERALELVPENATIGLGSGRAARMFVRALGERILTGTMNVRGVPTSEETAALARDVGVPLVTLGDVELLEATVDGADEVDSNLDLIKGYGRALVREKIVAASSRRLIILVGREKIVPRLGTRGKLPVEVVPFALPLCERRLGEMGLRPIACRKDGNLWVTDNGNHILDCQIDPIADATRLESDIRSIPGVVGTGLFLGMADTVLVGESGDFRVLDEMSRPGGGHAGARAGQSRPCKHEHQIPPVANEWQTVWCPNCQHYYRGACVNPTLSEAGSTCPFDGMKLPLREATGDARHE